MSEQTPNQNKPQIQKDLGLAGKTAKAFITSPLSPLLLVAFLAIGILGLMITPRQEDPQVSVPMADIFVHYPGASATEVESLIARPLEGILSEMTGVDHVYSASIHEQAMVTVQFIVGESMESSLVKLYDKISSNMDLLPRGASQPLVKPKGVDDVPVVGITLWSNEIDDSTLRLVGLDVLQEMRAIGDTSQSFIVDGRSEEVRVEIMPERLATYGIAIEQVANAVRLANSQRTAGDVEPNERTFKVITGSFLTSAADVNRLMVAVVGGRPVYIRDVAKVTEGPSEATRMVGFYTGPAYTNEANKKEGKTVERASGAAAVTLAIAKKNGSNGIEVADAILEKLEYLKGRTIPDNVHVEITRNYGESARSKVNALLTKLVKVTLIVTLLIWFALGWRAGIVVLVIIPVIVASTVFIAWLLGVTIDRVSLFALIFSIGILVDDAIVVVENIYRRWLLDNSTSIDVAVDAVREVGNPTILATATVIAALLPMMFVSGMMGPYMSPIPKLGSAAMIISLFAAFAFTPWLTYKLKPKLSELQSAAEKEHKQAAYMEKLFRGMIIPMIRDTKKGYAFLFGIVIVFFISISLFYTQDVRVKMLPLDNKPEFNVVINMPEGTAFPITANITNQLANELLSLPEVTALQTYIGTASPFNFNGFVRHYYLRKSPWQADIQIELTNMNDRERTSHEIADEARIKLKKLLAKINSKAKIQVVEMPPGPPVLQTVVAEIYGPDAEIRRQVARDMTKIFEKAKNVTDVDNMLEDDHELLRFKVDANKAQLNGISVEDVNRTLEMAMGGYILGDIRENALIEPTKIVLQVPLAVRSQINRLMQLPVSNNRGVFVPLSELGQFIREVQDKPIYHKDLRAVEFVTAEGLGKFAAPVYGMMEIGDLLEDYRTPDGVKLSGEWLGAPDKSNKSAFEWGGEWTVTYETFRDMGIAFAGAIILIYMLIVGQFGNFILPAIIIAPIPLTLIGIVPGHWLLDADFSATSMIGFIALAGIVVRNSILLVDFSREQVIGGMSVLDAVIYSCETRTRPIVITALALIGGSLFILSDPIFRGMAISLIFGGLVATLLTLLVIPLGCVSASGALMIKDPEAPEDPNPPTGGGSEPQKEGGSKIISGIMFFGTSIVATVSFVLRMIMGLFGFSKKIVAKEKTPKAPEPVIKKPEEASPKEESVTQTVKEVKEERNVVKEADADVSEEPKPEQPAKAIKPKARRGIRLKKEL
ncbi:MAG: efflux RND transporter permease subunit [Cocleimonas sp.]|nr:efflux RND transporter permease subunit [Cocleimonas sp.]